MARRAIDFLITLVVFGPPVLFFATYTGPFQWFSEAQLSAMGEYYETLSFLLTLLAWVVLCGLSVTVVQKARGKAVGVLEFTRNRDAIFARQFPMIVAVTTLAMLGIAAYYEHAYQTTRDPVHIAIQDLSQKWWPPGSYLKIDGAGYDSQNALSPKKQPTSETTYLPLLAGDYHKGQPVTAFVEIPKGRLHDQPVDPALLTTGLVEFSGLPGVIRVGFERNNMPPAHGSIVILYGSQRDDLHGDAGFMLMMAGVVAVIGTFTVFRVKRMIAQRSPPPST